jgi:hypothetical protein
MPKVGFVYKFLERGLCWKDEQFIRTSENDLFIVLSIKSRDERKNTKGIKKLISRNEFS